MSVAVGTEMHLALRLNLYRSATLDVPVDLVKAAEDLGYHSVWSAEAYGTDALSPLAYLAAFTHRIKLGTAIAQLAARPPATLAMHAMTIDALAGGGRVIIGIGRLGPADRRGLVRTAVGTPARRACATTWPSCARCSTARHRSTYEGTEISLPYRGPGSTGQGKALRSILHAVAPIPLWLASGGPKNTELCAEVADGWLPMGFGSAGDLTAARAGVEGAGRSSGGLRDLHRLLGPAHRRRGRDPGQNASADRHVRRGDGQRHPQLPPRRHGPARVPRPRPPASRSCGWPAARTRRWPPCPTSTSSRTRSSGTSSASGGAGPPWSPPPLSTGLIVDVPGVEELRLAAALRDGS